MTCTTCGQHYFVHHVRDFTFTDRAPGGGEAVENRVIWRPLEEQLGGDRIVFLDRLVVDATDDDDDDDAAPPPQPQLRALPGIPFRCFSAAIAGRCTSPASSNAMGAASRVHWWSCSPRGKNRNSQAN